MGINESSNNNRPPRPAIMYRDTVIPDMKLNAAKASTHSPVNIIRPIVTMQIIKYSSSSINAIYEMKYPNSKYKTTKLNYK